MKEKTLKEERGAPLSKISLKRINNPSLHEYTQNGKNTTIPDVEKIGDGGSGSDSDAMAKPLFKIGDPTIEDKTGEKASHLANGTSEASANHDRKGDVANQNSGKHSESSVSVEAKQDQTSSTNSKGISPAHESELTNLKIMVENPVILRR